VIEPLIRSLILLLALIGHFGWWVFAYNRINATGLPRSLVKFFEKVLCVPLTLLIPLVIGFLDGPGLLSWVQTGQRPDSLTSFASFYLIFSVAVVLCIGPLWLVSRLYLIPPKQLKQSSLINRLDLRHRRQELCSGAITNSLAILPGNDILSIESHRKSLVLPKWPSYLDGFRIGHISDLHFTGHLHPDFYRIAFAELQSLRPDFIALTGDIIDKQKCLPWITDLLGNLEAKHGKFFVLGNHDKRLPDTEAIRERLREGGWIDLGSQVVATDIHGHPLLLAGHELPWFGSEPSMSDYETESRHSSESQHDNFRLALAHSPDAFDWAQREGVHLLLAGHTHGGQVRLPGIGPIVAPSWYGSKFASGVFYRKPTLMHVSRGLAGVHPLRFRCAPEIAILELHSSHSSLPGNFAEQR